MTGNAVFNEGLIYNFIIDDCERITFVIFKDRRLTKMTMKTFKRKKYNTRRYSKLEPVYFLLPFSICVLLHTNRNVTLGVNP